MQVITFQSLTKSTFCILGLFGSTPAAGTFGTPAFGSTTPASGGLFGGGTSTGTSLFGNKTTQSAGMSFLV